MITLEKLWGMFHKADDEVDGLERMGVGEEGRTLIDWSGYFRLREETAMQPEIRLNLVTGRTSSGKQIS